MTALRTRLACGLWARGKRSLTLHRESEAWVCVRVLTPGFGVVKPRRDFFFFFFGTLFLFIFFFFFCVPQPPEIGQLTLPRHAFSVSLFFFFFSTSHESFFFFFCDGRVARLTVLRRGLFRGTACVHLDAEASGGCLRSLRRGSLVPGYYHYV